MHAGGKYFISLRGNRLTRFESDVFQPLLEIMVTDEEVSNNPMLDLFESKLNITTSQSYHSDGSVFY